MTIKRVHRIYVQLTTSKGLVSYEIRMQIAKTMTVEKMAVGRPRLEVKESWAYMAYSSRETVTVSAIIKPIRKAYGFVITQIYPMQNASFSVKTINSM